MILKTLLKRTISILPSGIQRSIYWNKNRITRSVKIKRWKLNGSNVPPPHQYKQFVVEEIAKKYNAENFVETGTFMGHMIEAQKNNFKQLFSVELDQELFRGCSTIF